MPQLYGVDSSKTNRSRITRNELPFYLILAITCESISRFLIRKRSRTIWDFHKQSKSRALSYLEALTRRWRYGITIIFSLRALILNDVRSCINLIQGEGAY